MPFTGICLDEHGNRRSVQIYYDGLISYIKFYPEKLNRLPISLFYPGNGGCAEEWSMQVRISESEKTKLLILSLFPGSSAGENNPAASKLLAQSARDKGVHYLMGPVLFVAKALKGGANHNADLTLKQFNDWLGLPQEEERPPAAERQRPTALAAPPPAAAQPRAKAPSLGCEMSYPALGGQPQQPLASRASLGSGQTRTPTIGHATAPRTSQPMAATTGHPTAPASGQATSTQKPEAEPCGSCLIFYEEARPPTASASGGRPEQPSQASSFTTATCLSQHHPEISEARATHSNGPASDSALPRIERMKVKLQAWVDSRSGSETQQLTINDADARQALEALDDGKLGELCAVVHAEVPHERRVSEAKAFNGSRSAKLAEVESEWLDTWPAACGLSETMPFQLSPFQQEALQERGLVRRPVLGDGDCQFRAFADEVGRHAQEVREDAVQYIETHPEQFRASIVADASIRQSFEEYLVGMRRSGSWGDDYTLSALALCYQKRIILLGPDFERPIEPTGRHETEEICLIYFQQRGADHHVDQYVGHYDATQRVVQDTVERSIAGRDQELTREALSCRPPGGDEELQVPQDAKNELRAYVRKGRAKGLRFLTDLLPTHEALREALAAEALIDFLQADYQEKEIEMKEHRKDCKKLRLKLSRARDSLLEEDHCRCSSYFHALEFYLMQNQQRQQELKTVLDRIRQQELKTVLDRIERGLSRHRANMSGGRSFAYSVRIFKLARRFLDTYRSTGHRIVVQRPEGCDAVHFVQTLRTAFEMQGTPPMLVNGENPQEALSELKAKAKTNGPVFLVAAADQLVQTMHRFQEEIQNEKWQKPDTVTTGLMDDLRMQTQRFVDLGSSRRTATRALLKYLQTEAYESLQQSQPRREDPDGLLEGIVQALKSSLQNHRLAAEFPGFWQETTVKHIATCLALLLKGEKERESRMPCTDTQKWCTPSRPPSTKSFIEVRSQNSIEDFRKGVQEVEYLVFEPGEIDCTQPRPLRKAYVMIRLNAKKVAKVRAEETRGNAERQDLENNIRQLKGNIRSLEKEVNSSHRASLQGDDAKKRGLARKIKELDGKKRTLEEKEQRLGAIDKEANAAKLSGSKASLEEWCSMGADHEPSNPHPVQNEWKFETSLEHYLCFVERLPFQTPGETGFVVFDKGAVGKGSVEGAQFVACARTLNEAMQAFTTAGTFEGLLNAARANSNQSIRKKAGRLQDDLDDAAEWKVNATIHESSDKKHLNIKGNIGGTWKHYHIYCHAVPGGAHGPNNRTTNISCIQAHGPKSSHWVIKDIQWNEFYQGQLLHAYQKDHEEAVKRNQAKGSRDT
ncbi:unnamed protein product [Effrenium voratum]|uniref:OTU domain-containing protein n=1 Tax=Effrenium voratum TaxID=2562239 RepID=A0AA36HQX6_9DINO|nr:unnamed protein product [Effrenium voratum]